MHIDRNISRVLAAAVASAGFAIPVPSVSTTLSCSSFTASPGSNGTIMVSCVDSTGGGTTACSISVSPTSLPASGGNVTVSANCGASASLSGGKALSQSGTNSWVDTIPANGLSTAVTYSYTISGDGGSKTAFVSQAGQGSTSPPPTSGGAISCPGFDKTIVLDLNWGAPGSAAPRVATSGFGGNSITVARFTTPSNSAANVYAQIKSGQWVDAAREVTASLSTSPCQFPSPNPVGRLATTTVGVVSPSVTYAVGGSSLYYAILQPNTTYYFNIKHEVNGVPTCASGSCNMFVELQKPNGL
jgi:hypothetical protein